MLCSCVDDGIVEEFGTVDAGGRVCAVGEIGREVTYVCTYIQNRGVVMDKRRWQGRNAGYHIETHFSSSFSPATRVVCSLHLFRRYRQIQTYSSLKIKESSI